jgi:condensin-2 complex subunit D3
VWDAAELTYDLPQELLQQVCGDVLSTCVHHLSSIVLKEDGKGNMDKDLLVSSCFV